MPRGRITHALGAAAGGLLGAAFLPAAIAYADDYEIIPAPSSTETLTGVYGLQNTAPPSESGSIQGYQEFEVLNTATHHVVGTFEADESNSVDILGNTNTELLVTQDLSGHVGTAAGDTPAVGSVLDSYTYAGDQFGYVYSDLTSATPGAMDTPSETVTTLTYGDFPVGSIFHAVAAESQATALPAITLAGGDQIVAAASPEQFTAISGAAPYDMAVQGIQVFDVENASGAVIGTFTGDVTTTTDVAGTTTEAILVTKDLSGTAGTAAGDTPAVGSIVDIIDYNDGPTPDIYSDLVSPTGGPDLISITDKTLFGDISYPYSYDAVGAESDDAAIPFDGYSITPGGPETFTGINGLPPADVAIQGTQEFDIDNGAGMSVGSFDADVTTTTTRVYAETTETLLVTSDGAGTVGTAAGDIPAVGSVIDVANYGFGFETVYADLISSTGASVISDTVVTPFGDFAIPTTFDTSSDLLANVIALF